MRPPLDDRGQGLSLVCRVGQRHLCALPLRYVQETLRPLPLVPMSGAPNFVLGLSRIRGNPAPVVDLAQLLSDKPGVTTRWISMAVEGRSLAVAAESVLGLQPLDASDEHAVAPLLRLACKEAVRAVASLDAELLLVLDATRVIDLVPSERSEA
ncbi:MAG: chemotaxis protein CheW [Burkholderiaceae bacterium]|nr:chemotaxis protein CheW [Burkholderiaceae bacterium]